MTTQELRELDAWIAEHVMGWAEDRDCQWVWHDERRRLICNFEPTVKNGDAMDVLKKCAEKTPQLMISTHGGRWIIGDNTLDSLVKAEAIELAICLFAKQLFSQTTK